MQEQEHATGDQRGHDDDGEHDDERLLGFLLRDRCHGSHGDSGDARLLVLAVLLGIDRLLRIRLSPIRLLLVSGHLRLLLVSGAGRRGNGRHPGRLYRLRRLRRILH